MSPVAGIIARRQRIQLELRSHDVIEAPLKGFYTFESSVHGPMFEEPERMNRILREDVLAGRNGLTDGGS